MIVVNKRYYDYDYDNNTIIMFDAEDVALTLDLDDVDYCSIDNHQLEDTSKLEKQQSAEQQKTKNPIQSQSTDSVPDDNIIAPTTPPIDIMTPVADEHEQDDNKSQTPPVENIYGISSSNKISWISSTSPKGSRRIPYALHIAHSYTISKLPVTLTQLVNTDTIQKKQEKEFKAKQAAAAHAAHAAHSAHPHYHYQQIHPHPHPHTHAHPNAHAHPQYHYPHPQPHPQYINTNRHAHGRPYHQYPYPYGRRKQENTLASPANHGKHYVSGASPRYTHSRAPQQAQYVYHSNNTTQK